jgi:hypothetical protein
MPSLALTALCSLLLAASATASAPVTVDAKVTSATPVGTAFTFKTRVTWVIPQASRQGLPATITQTLPGGRRGQRAALVSRWPLWRPGQRVRATFSRAGRRWTLASAREIGARASWTQSPGSASWPTSRVPIHWHLDPSTPAWARSAFATGASLWQADPGSWVQFAQDADATTGDLSDCSPSAGSWATVHPTRGLPNGDGIDNAIGLGLACVDGGGAYALHVWMDPDLGSSDARIVATHEIGHGLSFHHSADPMAMMAAPSQSTTPALGTDDIAGVRALYPGAYAIDVHGPDGQFAAEVRANPGQAVAVSFLTTVIGGATCAPATMWATVGGDTTLVGGGLAPGARVALAPRTPTTCSGQVTVVPAVGRDGVVRLSPGSAAGAVSGHALDITVRANRAPLVYVTTRGGYRAGDTTTVSATVTDPDQDAYTVGWDLDGDGAFDDASGPAASFVTTAGTRTVAAQAVDAMGLAASANRTLTAIAAAKAASSCAPQLRAVSSAKRTAAKRLRQMRAARRSLGRHHHKPSVRRRYTTSRQQRARAVRKLRSARQALKRCQR